MTAEKALTTLREAFNEKAREQALAAITEVQEGLSEAEHNRSEIAGGLAALSAYDSTFVGISLEEGVRRLRERITEQQREVTLLRGLNSTSDDVITSAKVALIESVTADHRWHTPEENCPHVRCIALNKIGALRDDN